jgi:hypothetical protein
LIKQLKTLHDTGYVDYNPPYRGKTTKIVGPVSLVDHDRVTKKLSSLMDKLNDVEDFVRVPDKDKHDYLLKYFGID